MANDKNPTFFQKGYSSSANGQRLLKSAGWANAGVQALNMLNSAYGATNNVGNALTTAGGLVGSIPTPYTAAAGAVLGLAGGVANLFTDSVNEDYKNRINSQIANLAGVTSDATDFAGLQEAYNNLSNFNIDIGDISNWGSKGLFVSEKNSKRTKARNLAIEALGIANETALGNLAETGRTINQNNFSDQYMNLMSFGGPLHTHGADWMNGITIIGNGGSHESNPFEGVPMGIAPDGQPNLVEEGEVIFNDYVFSNRIKVPKAVREKYKLRGQREMTFADAAKKAQKESEERPNDPISQRGLEDIMNRLMIEQETIRERKNMRQYSEGGKIHIAPSKRGTFTAAASKHGMGVQEFASKVLANPEDYSPAMRKKANFARNASKWKHSYGGHLYADGDYLWNWNADTKPTAYEEMKTTPAPWLTAPVVPLQSNVVVPYRTSEPSYIRYEEPAKKKFKLNASILRYAPALGAGIGVLTDLFGITNRPDYTNADTILNTARESTRGIRDVTFKPIGNYLAYKPFDTLFYANQLGAQAGATRRAIRNNSNGNRMTAIAGLLAADYNAQNQLGNLFRQAEEYNLAQRERVENFNRGTDEFNSEGLLKAAIANAENAQQKAKINLTAAERAAAIRDAVDTRVSAARSANLTNLFDNLGNIGIDAYNRKDRDMLLRAGIAGTLSQKPQEWSQKRWDDYRRELSGTGYKNGGIVRKRKGITI